MRMMPGDYSNLVAFLAGLHDLGKFTRNFQAKVEGLWPACLLGAWPGPLSTEPSHWRATGLLLQLDPLSKAFGALFPNLCESKPLIAAVAGHHGRPPPREDTAAEARSALRRRLWIDRVCLEAAQCAFDTLRSLTGVQPAPSIDDDSAPIDTPLGIYWREALATAERALVAKGLAPLRGVSAPRLGDLSPRVAASPRPMQRLAETLSLACGPQTLILEDATGSGKTEAALLIAARLFAEAPEARPPSVILSHGKSALAAALAKLEAKPGGDGEETTAASCNAWIADDRRRAFFADVGAGTIDQAFLAVLPKKHLTLRQYALAGRILIVDEAHCFDAYMQEELGALLRLHAMNGGSAIVLSATLASGLRQKIAQRFYQGLGQSPQNSTKAAARCASSAYPLLTHLSRDDVKEFAPGLDERLARTVTVERLENRIDAHRVAGAAADAGAAVLVLCNAVDEAIAVHEALAAERAQGTVHLFHARFAQGDRIAIEEAMLKRFGRKASTFERAGHVLVATQVVEQSLDLDFDLVICDLAPIDLLIQRAGRLWRHMDVRPAASRAGRGPRLLVVSPEWAPAASADWLEPSLGRAAFVYRHAGVMWRTAPLAMRLV